MKSSNISKKWRVFFILDKTLSHFTENGRKLVKSFRLLFIIAFVVLAPLAILFGYSNVESFLNIINFDEFFSTFSTQTLWLLFYVSISLFVNAILQSVTVFQFKSFIKNFEFSSNIFKFTIHKIPALILLAVIELALAVLLIFLYIGASTIFDLDFIASIFGMVLFGMFFWFFISTSFACFAVLADGMSVIDSIIYSIRIVKGAWWSTFVYYSIVTILILIVSSIINFTNEAYFSKLPMRDLTLSFNFTLELQRIFSFILDLTSNLVFFFYYISLFFWYRYRKATYAFSGLMK